MKKELDESSFYMIGIIAFSIVALFSFLNILVYPDHYTLLTKISSLGQIVFNLALIFFFWTLRKRLNINSSVIVEDIKKNFEEAVAK